MSKMGALATGELGAHGWREITLAQAVGLLYFEDLSSVHSPSS